GHATRGCNVQTDGGGGQSHHGCQGGGGQPYFRGCQCVGLDEINERLKRQDNIAKFRCVQLDQDIQKALAESLTFVDPASERSFAHDHRDDCESPQHQTRHHSCTVGQIH